MIAYRGEQCSLMAQLLQNGTYGNPVIGEPIQFYEETRNILLGTCLTDSQGYATLEWQIPADHPLGPTLVNATYRGNETLFLAPTCQWLDISILMRTKLDVNTSETVLAPNDLLSISAELHSQQGEPLASELLELRHQNITIASTMTNTHGAASFQLHVNTSWAVYGENLLTLSHPQNLDSYTSQSEESVTVIIEKITSWFDYNLAHSGQVYLGDILNLHIRLNSTEGCLSQMEVGIYLDGAFQTNIQTNASGSLELGVRIDEQFAIGYHDLVIRYTGSERYAACEETIGFSTFSPVFTSLDYSGLPIIESNFTLRIDAQDRFGRSIPNLVMQIYDQTTDLQMTVNCNSSSSLSTIEFPLQPPKGPHEIHINFIGNPYLSNSSLNHTIYCWSHPVFSDLTYSIEGYAFPGQEISVQTQVHDYSGPLPEHTINLLVDGGFSLSTKTNRNGALDVSLISPLEEGDHILILHSQKRESEYLAESSISYSFTVTEQIPVRIDLLASQTIPQLRVIDVTLEARILNGSRHNGLVMQYQWLGTYQKSQCNPSGLFQLQLSLPTLPGLYDLGFQLLPTASTRGLNGSFILTISEQQILAAEGVGIPALAFSLVSSSFLAIIPLLRRRYLIG